MAAIAAAAVLAALAFWIWRLLARLRRAERAERQAVERRDRFLVEAAGELQAPLESLHAQVQAIGAAAAPELARELERLRAMVAELAHLPRRPAGPLDEVDLAEVVREIVAEPPFSDRGPSVVLRATATPVLADRPRLQGGLRVLLWTVRREADPRAPLVITVSTIDDRALVEIDARGARALGEALELEPAVGYGLRPAAAPRGTTLALRVAAQVAHAHGGRLSGSARPPAERFTLEIPALHAAAA
ncbi:MAG TPA: hypothetical protein VFF06_36780 [Polyangia bacterium]|nr:hypothetical protein [Polyangia bacterium]